MEMLIAVVTIALIGLIGYAIYTDPPSSGCLSVDAARARDEKLKRQASRKPAVAVDPAATGKPEAPPAVIEAKAEPEPDRPAQSLVLRNPLTGETAPVPNNYRFAKRWIKQAMVDEGLLEKVYSNSELKEPNAAKVKAALLQFKDLPKYRS